MVSARRSLESLTRVVPEPAAFEDYVQDDLKEEAPLASWLGKSSDDLVSVKPAIVATEVAARSRSAARAQWVPTVAAQGQEHLTNAGSFTGQHEIYTLSGTVSWRADFGLAPTVAAQTAALGAAQAREDKARWAGEDAIYQAWFQVHAASRKCAPRARRSLPRRSHKASLAIATSRAWRRSSKSCRRNATCSRRRFRRRRRRTT